MYTSIVSVLQQELHLTTQFSSFPVYSSLNKTMQN